MLGIISRPVTATSWPCNHDALRSDEQRALVGVCDVRLGCLVHWLGCGFLLRLRSWTRVCELRHRSGSTEVARYSAPSYTNERALAGYGHNRMVVQSVDH